MLGSTGRKGLPLRRALRSESDDEVQGTPRATRRPLVPRTVDVRKSIASPHRALIIQRLTCRVARNSELRWRGRSSRHPGFFLEMNHPEISTLRVVMRLGKP